MDNLGGPVEVGLRFLSKRESESKGERGFPGGAGDKESTYQCRRHMRHKLGQEDALEEEMATCSSILAWIIPWT